MSDLDDILNRLRACWCADAFKSRGLVDNYCDHDGVRAEAAEAIQQLRGLLWKYEHCEMVTESPCDVDWDAGECATCDNYRKGGA